MSDYYRHYPNLFRLAGKTRTFCLHEGIISSISRSSCCCFRPGRIAHHVFFGIFAWQRNSIYLSRLWNDSYFPLTITSFSSTIFIITHEWKRLKMCTFMTLKFLRLATFLTCALFASAVEYHVLKFIEVRGEIIRQI
jgi:hypothetical protein